MTSPATSPDEFDPRLVWSLDRPPCAREGCGHTGSHGGRQHLGRCGNCGCEGYQPPTGTVRDAVGTAMGVIPPSPDEPFLLAPEVHDVADALMDRFPSFNHLAEHRLAYLFQTAMPKPRGGCSTIGKAHVVNDLYGVLTGGLNGIVVVNQPWWVTATDRQRQALVYHELCHFETNPETGELGTVKHDLEVFIGEAAHFGDWRSGIREVSEQLSMWQREQRD